MYGSGNLVSYGRWELRLLVSGQVGCYMLLMVIFMLVVFVLQYFVR